METRSTKRLTALLLAANVLVSACGGGGGSGPPPDNMSTTVMSISGDGQSGRVGEVLPDPIEVVVTEAGQPAADVTVTWSTTAAGGELTPASGTTDAAGRASSSWTLGSVSGTQTAQATVSGASGSPVIFNASAFAGTAVTLAKAGGDGQTGETNTSLANPLQAKVTDQFGNSVAGTDVNWSSSGAAVSAPMVASDAAGISQVTVTLGGTAGPITITAESNGLTGSPLSFSATAVAGVPPPSNISVEVGNDFFQSNRNNSVGPAVDTVAVGGTVTWTWAATAAAHNVTSNPPPSFTNSPTQAAGTVYQFTFTAAGTYRYYCTLHASSASTTGMVGRIVVR
jgi:plastocyanin